jgi:hypothetical protein
MIEYLFNNSINETFLAKALYNHSRIRPSISSWRDLVDIFFITLFIITLIYFIICRAGFSLCDQLVAFLFRPVLNRLQQKTKHQQQTSTLSAGNPNTISQQIQSLSMFADGTQLKSKRTTH